MLRLGAIGFVALVSGSSLASGEPPCPPLPATDLLYVSDYFSFVGRDDLGHVAFGLDNNRGRDGERYQAEHFVVLHDEHQGWIEVAGTGAYENRAKQLTDIPDSPFFQFGGNPTSGLLITGPENNLTLRIDPIPAHERRTSGDAVVWMGSTAATLTWGQRTIPGRVIYEYLMMPNFNRLTRTYWGMWNDFQGLYLLAHGPASMTLTLSERKSIANWVIGGFSMGIVRGELSSGGQTWPAYGLAELIE